MSPKNESMIRSASENRGFIGSGQITVRSFASVLMGVASSAFVGPVAKHTSAFPDNSRAHVHSSPAASAGAASPSGPASIAHSTAHALFTQPTSESAYCRVIGLTKTFASSAAHVICWVVT